MANCFIRVVWAKAVFAAVVWAGGASAQIFLAPPNQGSEDIGVYPVAPNFYMLAGAGGNIAVQTGPDGVVLVDAGSAEMTDKVLAAVAKLSDQPIRYIINTSADSDRTGGNAAISKAGQSFLQNAPGLFAGGPTLGVVGAQNPAAIVCLTDGLDTSADNADKVTAEAVQRGVPIYFVPGENHLLPGSSLALREVKAPARVQRSSEWTIAGSIRWR